MKARDNKGKKKAVRKNVEVTSVFRMTMPAAAAPYAVEAMEMLTEFLAGELGNADYEVFCDMDVPDEVVEAVEEEGWDTSYDKPVIAA